MKFGIVTFPGSNCDHDCFTVARDVLQQEAEFLWYKDRNLKECDCIILPGGFSYGDYLRCGAIARFAPIMEEVVAFAKKGGPVIGICNGFQILTEAGLLPGALLRNTSLQFLCRDVHLKVENKKTRFTTAVRPDVIRVPVAHGEGRFFADPDMLARIEQEGCVAFRYASPAGAVRDAHNANGSLNSIAGIVSFQGNVLGMMPHPERCSEALLGNTDGRGIFDSVIANFVN
ncbi:MAG: phosphoribosylformylglycinamidine synthase subunit PurQ [Fibrobacterota bacterium]